MASPGSANLLDPHDPTTAWLLDVGPGGQGISISPAGTTVVIASADNDGAVRLWDTRTGALLHVLHGAQRLAFDPTGDLLATSVEDERVQIWDV